MDLRLKSYASLVDGSAASVMTVLTHTVSIATNAYEDTLLRCRSSFRWKSRLQRERSLATSFHLSMFIAFMSLLQMFLKWRWSRLRAFDCCFPCFVVALRRIIKTQMWSASRVQILADVVAFTFAQISLETYESIVSPQVMG